MVYFLDLLYSQLLVKIPEQTSDFTGQTVVVTGSNTGLGREAARLLVRLNATKVILAVRTLSKGESAANSIITSCNVSASRVEVWQLDMSNKDSIVAFAKRAAGLDRLDAAILNAGVFNFRRNDIDGTEAHLAVNVIGTTLLELLLLPTLQKSATRTGLRSRLTLVGSDMMYTVNPADFQTDGAIFPYLNTRGVQPENNYYAYSKWLVYQASRRVAESHPVSKESNVLITVQTPGACKSDLFREESGGFMKVVSWVMFAVFARTTEAGARTLVHAVSSELPEEAHGQFLMDTQVQE
jgi:NAD(P)-dependent dehydrogenase (short-subunit alcohol dehydrogenase family)